MDARSFLQNFGYIADAPDGVKRLRNMIRVLATTGQLATNISTETSSKSLLKIIQIEYQERLAKKEFRKPTVRKKTSSLDSLKSLPKNWCWCPLEQIFYPISVPNSKKLPSKQIKQKGRYPVIDQGLAFISGYSDDNQKLIKLDQPVVVFGDHTRGLKFVNFNFIPGGDGIKILCPIQINPQYFFLVLQSFNINVRGYARHYQLLLDNYFPLPPTEEQKRIVTKVDELMALCDKLEAQQQKRQQLFPVLSRATHARLVESPTPTNLKAIFKEIETVSPEDLRKTVLSLAVSGKLTKQLESIPNNILSELKNTKAALAAQKLIKREKPIINFAGLNEIKTTIPDEWIWCRLNDIASVVRGGSPRPAGDPRFYGGDIPFLKVADVTRSEGMMVEGYKFTITEAGLKKTRLIEARTVLLTNSGATLGIPAICDFKATFNDGIAAFIYLNENVLDDFLYIYLKSKSQWFLDIASRGQGQPNLNTDIIRATWFPLPPIDEQRKIVTIADHLLSIIDHLEKQQTQKSKIAQAFAQASVTAITGTQIKEQQKMKAPKTELITKLQIGKKSKPSGKTPLAGIISKHKGELSAKALWQQSGMKIDAFYQQLKVEMANGWIVEPEKAFMREQGAK